MTGKLFIDGNDAYLTYEVCVADGSYIDLISLPAFKPFTLNDWEDADGEEPDLSNPVLPARSITIPFIARDAIRYNALLNALTNGVYHTFSFTRINRSYKLRLTQTPSYIDIDGMGLITMRFADDFPPVYVNEEEENTLALDPAVPIINQSPFSEKQVDVQGYTIDGLDLSAFGIFLLEGSDDSIRKPPEIKAALTRGSNYLSGQSYDEGSQVYYKAKDVTLNLFMHPRTMEGFWKQWNAFHTILLSPGEKTIEYSKTASRNLGYYKGTKVTYFDYNTINGIWCEFKTTLRYTDI